MKKILTAMALLAAGSASATIVGVGDATDNGDGSYFIASGGDLGSGVSTADLEDALGVFNGYVNIVEDVYDGFDDGDVFNGSALTRSIFLQDGDTISFDWIWNTNEPLFSLNNDFAFVSVTGNGIDNVLAGIVADNFATGLGEGGSFTYTHSLGAGQFTFGIAIVDVDIFDPAVNDSFLDVSNIRAVAVPAPAGIALLALGLIGLGAARRK